MLTIQREKKTMPQALQVQYNNCVQTVYKVYIAELPNSLKAFNSVNKRRNLITYIE